jgi:hypothetical protein
MFPGSSATMAFLQEAPVPSGSVRAPLVAQRRVAPVCEPREVDCACAHRAIVDFPSRLAVDSRIPAHASVDGASLA